jgi:TctA family transporter
MLMVGSPELLACCIFGLSLVAVLSGGNAFKGLAAVCLGLMLAMIGEDSQAGELRWTFDTIYLWDGIPIVPIALGLFAIPELADLAIRRSTVVREEFHDVKSSQREGVMDVIRHKWLVIRCASIGSLMGAVPGIGSAVIDWIAYGHAAKTEKGAQESFGKGDVRGVIASESSNNAKEGGSLVPTIAFGVPGSASMALLLGAFTVQGIVPGPDMLSKNLDVTYALVWSVALANVIGAGICFGGAHILAKLALVRASLLVPVVLGIAFIGAFQGQKAWGDLYILIAAGVVGFIMKRLGWPRPPVILGFVLGALVERYMFISVRRYEADWIFHPMVAILLLLSLYMVFAPTVNGLLKRMRGRASAQFQFGWMINASRWDILFTAMIFAVFVYGISSAQTWAFSARLFPTVIGWVGSIAVLCLFLSMCIRRVGGMIQTEVHMDSVEEFKGLEVSTVAVRAVIFFGWCIGYLVMAAILGMLPAMALFIFGFLYWTGRERLHTSILMTVAVVALSYGLFHWILIVPWPEAWIGDVFPMLREIRALRLF